MDNLINTYDNLVGNDELNSSNVDEVRSHLLRFRIDLHSLLDEDINLISKMKNL